MRPDLEQTDQQLFDTMVAQLRSQHGRSIYEGCGTMCAYRGGQGRKCPVGAVIPDDLYSKGMEGFGITQLSKLSWVNPDLQNMLRQHHPLLADMQYIHDNTMVETWEQGFQLVAAKHGLLLDGKSVDIPPDKNPMINRGSPGIAGNS